MADVYKGLTIQLGAETTGLTKALKGIDKQSRGIQSELKKVETALKFNPGNTDLLRQKQELLAKQIGTTKDRLNALKQAQSGMGKEDIGTDAYRNLQREIIETQSKLKTLDGKAKDTRLSLIGIGDSTASLDGVKNTIKNVATAAGVMSAAAGAALTAMAGAALENADELQRQADVTGLSAERLQELQYAGNNLGVDLDTLTGAQSKLTKSMAAAQGGTGKQADAFKALGIAVVDSNGNLRDAKDVMGEAFDKLSGVGNETERDAIAMQLFGKSAMEMNPMIKAGSDELNRLAQEARDNGSVMSNEAVAGLDTFGDTMDNLKSGIMGAFGEKLAEFTPAITGFVKMLEDGYDPLDAFGVVMGESFGIDVTPFTDGIQIAFDVIKDFGTWIVENEEWLVPITAGVLAMVAAFKAWSLATTALSVAQGILNVVMAANPIGIIILAIVGLVAMFVTLWKTNETFRDVVTKVWTVVKTAVSGVVDWFKGLPAKFTEMKDKIVEKFNAIKTGITDKITAAKNTVKEAIDKIKGFFDFKWELPKLKLPHFKLTGSFDLAKMKVPKLSVDWYAQGGIFDGPSVIGVGEAGREAVVPLQGSAMLPFATEIARLINQRGNGSVTQNFYQPVRTYSEMKRAQRDRQEELAW